MKPFEYYYDTINRNAIIVKPKDPFFNWQNQVFPDDEPIHNLEENNIYLIREMDDNHAIRNWLKKNFNDIFSNELNDWCSNEKLWPEKRTFKMFADWFDLEIHSMILDLEEGPVRKD